MWYRVADLHPCLRAHVHVNRQVYRGETWHMLQDTSSGGHFHLNDSAYQFIGRMDGRLSVQQIWDALISAKGDEAPSQPEVIQILTRLHQGNLIQCEISPDFDELTQRRETRQRQKQLSAISPLAFRISLFDPTRFLDKFQPYVRPLFQPWATLLWFVMTGFALLSAAQNWDVLSAHASMHLTTPRYLLLLWICYPLIKALHELGHAFAVRNWGGEVHEIGITLLVLVPVPYVDASAATAFRGKFRRIMVSAAGIMVELMLASLAMILWLNVEDGLLRDIAFVVMLIGGVSTLLFNANPLLKFDGYFILSDMLELPNLATRSNAYLLYLAKRYLLGMAVADDIAITASKRLWFSTYGIASWCYRIFVTIIIIGWIGATSTLAALLAALFFIWRMLLKPTIAAWHFLLDSPQLNTRRSRAVLAAGGLTLGLAVFLGVVPMPYSTLAEGVVWLPEQARVRPDTDGFIQQILVKDGQPVKRGQALFVLINPDLTARRDEVDSRLSGLTSKLFDAMHRDPAKAQAASHEMKRARAELKQIDERLAGLLIRSPSDGMLAIARQQDLESTYVAKGTILANVLAPEEISVRAVLTQDAAILLKQRTHAVEVRLAENPAQNFTAKLTGEIPAATSTLPSAALGGKGGGQLVTDPADKDGLQTLQPVFLVDLRIPSTAVKRIGGRAWVRFDHGAEPLLFQWTFRFQQLFLKYLSHEN